MVESTKGIVISVRIIRKIFLWLTHEYLSVIQQWTDVCTVVNAEIKAFKLKLDETENKYWCG